MGVSHGGGDIFVTKQVLNRSNVVAVYKKMRGKAVALCVA